MIRAHHRISCSATLAEGRQDVLSGSCRQTKYECETRDTAFAVAGCGRTRRQRDGGREAFAYITIGVEPSVARCGRKIGHAIVPATRKEDGANAGWRPVAASGTQGA